MSDKKRSAGDQTERIKDHQYQPGDKWRGWRGGNRNKHGKPYVSLLAALKRQLSIAEEMRRRDKALPIDEQCGRPPTADDLARKWLHRAYAGDDAMLATFARLLLDRVDGPVASRHELGVAEGSEPLAVIDARHVISILLPPGEDEPGGSLPPAAESGPRKADR